MKSRVTDPCFTLLYNSTDNVKIMNCSFSSTKHFHTNVCLLLPSVISWYNREKIEPVDDQVQNNLLTKMKIKTSNCRIQNVSNYINIKSKKLMSQYWCRCVNNATNMETKLSKKAINVLNYDFKGNKTAISTCFRLTDTKLNLRFSSAGWQWRK